MKSLFSRKHGAFSFEERMFPSQKGCSVEKISASYMWLGVSSSSLSTVPPLKISDRTLEKISSQSRTASSMFFFSCRFLLRLAVLVTDHTKPPEREPVPKAVEPLPNLVELVPNHIYLLHNYQNLREVSRTKGS